MKEFPYYPTDYTWRRKEFNQFLKYQDNLCYACQLKEDSFEHLFDCTKYDDLKVNSRQICPSDIYSEDLYKQYLCGNLAKKLFNRRCEYKEKVSTK